MVILCQQVGMSVAAAAFSAYLPFTFTQPAFSNNLDKYMNVFQSWGLKFLAGQHLILANPRRDSKHGRANDAAAHLELAGQQDM
jgi:hypothetical protein